MQGLPAEVWLLVLGFLGSRDRLRARAVCRGFRQLVDRAALWRGWTARLRAARGYNGGFWRTLRRWRVSSVVLSSLKEAEVIGANLPGLAALTLERHRDPTLQGLQSFPELKRLSLRQRCSFSAFPTQLTHLSLCEDQRSRGLTLDASSLKALGRLQRLRALLCHSELSVEPAEVLPSLLKVLPGLTHLSVTLRRPLTPPTVEAEPEEACHDALQSLELLQGVSALPQTLMKMMPALHSLALRFPQDQALRFPQDQALQFPQDQALLRKLRQWLEDLPGLRSLQVEGGPAVQYFVNSVPVSVSYLSLRPSNITEVELGRLSERLPLLRHLHLEPDRFLAEDTGLLPDFFPRLRSLRVRHEWVSEQVFLRLAELQDLKLLETTDPTAPPQTLVSKLRDLTQNRVQIRQRPRPDSPSCSCDLPSQTWLHLDV